MIGPGIGDLPLGSAVSGTSDDLIEGVGSQPLTFRRHAEFSTMMTRNISNLLTHPLFSQKSCTEQEVACISDVPVLVYLQLLPTSALEMARHSR